MAALKKVVVNPTSAGAGVNIATGDGTITHGQQTLIVVAINQAPDHNVEYYIAGEENGNAVVYPHMRYLDGNQAGARFTDGIQ